MPEKLRECPFCGGRAVLTHATPNLFRVVCADGCCRIPDRRGFYCSSEKIAFDMWNHRPTEQALRAENERLRDALIKISTRTEVYELPSMGKHKGKFPKRLNANDMVGIAKEVLEEQNE